MSDFILPPLPPLPPSPAELIKKTQGTKLLFCSDFDGTLVPIAATPEEVHSDPALARVKDLIKRVSAHFPFAICTGRALKDLSTLLPDTLGMDRIGNHGGEWALWRGRSVVEARLESPAGWEEWRTRFLPALQAQVKAHGGLLEDKGLSFAIHFRLSGTAWWSGPLALTWLDLFLSGSESPAALLRGESSWNIHPKGISKGRAVAKYAREFGFDAVVYFGDEATDETVFEESALVPWSVKVGKGLTEAHYRVPDVFSVQDWLAELALISDQYSTRD